MEDSLSPSKREDYTKLRIKDLESIKMIVEAKVKELHLVVRAKDGHITTDQEHKLVSRVLGDTI
jgi:hypothetical protein